MSTQDIRATQRGSHTMRVIDRTRHPLPHELAHLHNATHNAFTATAAVRVGAKVWSKYGLADGTRGGRSLPRSRSRGAVPGIAVCRRLLFMWVPQVGYCARMAQ
eukprot:464040-Prymnesium_polylepis.1